MTEQGLNITLGHIARHTPQGAGAQGREAAIIDVAQDLILRRLHEDGALENLAFKGGTALRKLYAGSVGRFSLDMDFSVAQIESDPDETMMNVIAAIDGVRIGPFLYSVVERRGKWSITYEHDFGSTRTLSSKLDISPPPWLSPVFRGWVFMPIHKQYGIPALPALKTVRLEENIAEKIARLNRTTPARDMYDLAWIATNAGVTGELDKALIRHLAVLKIWVDANGFHASNTWWKPGHESFPFDPAEWLRGRGKKSFDTEDIGALATSVPTARELSETVNKFYGFLLDLNDEERQLAKIKEQDRPIALKLLSELPDCRLRKIKLY